MSSKARRGGADKGKESGEDGVVDRKMIETIREATGATEDDIRVMLFECNFDANETTSRLIDSKQLCYFRLASVVEGPLLEFCDQATWWLALRLLRPCLYSSGAPRSRYT